MKTRVERKKGDGTPNEWEKELDTYVLNGMASTDNRTNQ